MIEREAGEVNYKYSSRLVGMQRLHPEGRKPAKSQVMVAYPEIRSSHADR